MTGSGTERRALGVIPARYASTRFPGKAIAPIDGKPMVQRVIESARQARLLDQIVVATDHPYIQAAAQACDCPVVMPEGNFNSGTDRIAAGIRDYSHEIVVNIQGDLPYLPAEMIDAIVEPLLANPTIPCATLARQVTESAELTDRTLARVIMDQNQNALYFSRATIPFAKAGDDEMHWLERGAYYRHIGLYGFQREFLQTVVSLPQSPLENIEGLEQLRILEHGYQMRVVLTKLDVYPVDRPEDVAIVERRQRQAAGQS
jgi:3-deoxy-manno-octulosonate cytidylyltransferase (CMP-KDO synthetase)